MPMAEDCQTSAALVRPPTQVHTPTTGDEALIRPLQGCTTYKEALVRPPPVNMSQQLETDDCLCERCGHIMARVFAMAANKTDQARQQIQNQFETHNRRRESSGPQGPYRRELNGPQGPYRREQYYSRNYNQQFEDPRSNRTFKPPIAEKGRWVTLGSPNLKPIHQKVYKYGFNPNFNKMTKTQRRRWIRNQADDMECEETVPVKEDKNIYVGRNDKKPVEEKEIKKEKPYETTRVYIGKKPKRKNQTKPEKLIEEAVSETAKSDLVETEKIEADDTNIDAGENLLEDEDDDGEKFALSIGAIRKEEPTQIENMQEDDQDQETNTNVVDCNMVYVLPREFMFLERLELEENEDKEETRELPGLDRKLMEHRLPIKTRFEPYQQAPRRMAPDIILKVKEEIERLVAANFIRPARYVEWLSNIVPVMKKNGKLRICVDFRNLNNATPKDEYPMPMADLLVDGVAGYQILSMMDGHSGYNQIFIAKKMCIRLHLDVQVQLEHLNG
uniref:Reverse transcriptase domain-containing protein n=1 Tax=Fagus sylvatica TaxID=28930 RepID=A0A2N9IET6_FAGSY